jgi:outer membrane protein insertion porin family
VNVEEQPTGSLGFSLSYSTDTGAGIAINFSEENFLGRGQSLRFGVSTVEGGQSFNFAFTEPAFLARDVSLGLNLYYEQTQSQDRSFDTEDYGFSTSFGFPASENGRFGLSYRIDQREIDFGAQAGNSSPIITVDAGQRLTSAVGLNYSFDNRTTGLNPNAGVFFNLARSLQGLGGDAEYVRAQSVPPSPSAPSCARR